MFNICATFSFDEDDFVNVLSNLVQAVPEKELLRLANTFNHRLGLPEILYAAKDETRQIVQRTIHQYVEITSAGHRDKRIQRYAIKEAIETLLKQIAV